MAQSQVLTQWALPRLSLLLPLDDDSLKQIITYSDSLSKQTASEHLKNLLGDSPQALEFISSFNTRRPSPPSDSIPSTLATRAKETPASSADQSKNVPEAEDAAVPKVKPKVRGKNKPFNQLPPPRRPDDAVDSARAYKKKDHEDDYIAGRKQKEQNLANTLSLDPTPSVLQLPNTTTSITATSNSSSAAATPPSTSRNASPRPVQSKTTKSSTTKPTPSFKFSANSSTMHTPSAALSDIDTAIRSLEATTNPTLQPSSTSRACNCQAQRHALLDSAPNCLNCGKIICAKEGLGPCTYCDVPLLKSQDVQAMLRALREERGREKTAINNAAQARPQVGQTPRAFASNNSNHNQAQSTTDTETVTSLQQAQTHRNRLLTYQRENALRTTIHDEASDVATPDTGLSIWATPTQRALQLKKQQKVLKEQAWNSRADWEKRKVVLALDVEGGGGVRKMVGVEREEELQDDDENEMLVSGIDGEGRQEEEGGKGLARNPFMGKLIRPVYRSSITSSEIGKGKGRARDVSSSVEEGEATRRRSGWTTSIVQNDNDSDNEAWILDGGAYGSSGGGGGGVDMDHRVLAGEEPACG